MEEINNKTTNELRNIGTDPINIGMNAPNFMANTTMGNIRLSDFNGKWLILFSHPGDFTPVCTTEFIAFSKMYPEFQKRNCNLLGLSIDSNPSHLSWVYNIYRSTGITVPFPIICDINMEISKMYGMISPSVSNTSTVRKVFIIDPNQVVRCILTYPMSCGRNICEILRILDSLQNTDNNGTSTPANWIPGQATIISPPNTYNQLMERVSEKDGFACLDWYLCFNEKNEI